MIRIFRKVETNPITGCWIYTGSLGRDGYGLVKGKQGEGTQRVHRVVYGTLVRPLVGAEEPHHACLVPRCCNPAHLTVETNHSDHMTKHHGHRR